MKLVFALKCSIAALVGITIAKLVLGTPEPPVPNSEPRDILLADHLHGHWITIGRINHREPGGEFNPNWTYILLEKPIKPVIKKVGDRYQISFTTELTENLP